MESKHIPKIAQHAPLKSTVAFELWLYTRPMCQEWQLSLWKASFLTAEDVYATSSLVKTPARFAFCLCVWMHTDYFHRSHKQPSMP